MSASVQIGPFSLTTPSASEAVLVANTPTFLFDRLKKDVAVQTVVENMSAREIIDSLRDRLARPAKNPIELVLGYIYLIALASAIDPADVQTLEIFRSLDLSALEWGPAIRALILAEAVPTSTMEIQAADKPRP
jgi:hypothetical protein